MENRKQGLLSVLKYFVLYVLLINLTPLLIYLLVYLYETMVAGRSITLDALMDNSLIDDASLIVGNLLVLVLFLRQKYTRLDWARKPVRQLVQQKKVLGWALLLELAAILPITLFVSVLDFGDFEMVLEENVTLTFTGMVGVVLLAPMAEELVMRGAIEEKLLQTDGRAGMAIGVSALLFALPHLYPSLMVNAFLFGLTTGWVYYRTRNVLFCMGMHMLVNGISCVLDFLNMDHSSSDFAHETRVIFLTLLSAVVLVLAVTQLKKATAGQPAEGSHAG